MKKIFTIGSKIILTLLLITPILGSLGIFPPPTREMYGSQQAYDFIMATINSGYITVVMSVCFALAIYFLWTGRDSVAALLIAPITVNIVGFHAFIDGGLLTSGALMGNVLLVLNCYYLWKNREKYRVLLAK